MSTPPSDSLRVDLLTPLEFRTIPCPTYPEIRLSLMPRRKLRQRIGEFAPDALHIATEGPLGMAARPGITLLVRVVGEGIGLGGGARNLLRTGIGPTHRILQGRPDFADG